MQQILSPELKRSLQPEQTVDEQLKQEQEYNAKLKKQKQLDELQKENLELNKEVNGDPVLANGELSQIREEQLNPLSTSINKDKLIAKGTQSIHDLNKTWIEKNPELFYGGIFTIAILIFLSRMRKR
jgi:hypothetical protein